MTVKDWLYAGALVVVAGILTAVKSKPFGGTGEDVPEGCETLFAAWMQAQAVADNCAKRCVAEGVDEEVCREQCKPAADAAAAAKKAYEACKAAAD